MGFHREQLHRGRRSRSALSHSWLIRSARSRSRQLPRQIVLSPLGPSSADSSGYHHRTLPAALRGPYQPRSQPNHHFPGARHRADLRSYHRTLRRLAKNGSPSGRSFLGPRRNSLAYFLARDASQSQTLSHRFRPAHLHSFHGRNRRHFFPLRPRIHAPPRNLGPPAPRHHSRNQRYLHAHPSRLH